MITYVVFYVLTFSPSHTRFTKFKGLQTFTKVYKCLHKGLQSLKMFTGLQRFTYRFTKVYKSLQSLQKGLQKGLQKCL